jgi:hypothetical protein
MQTTLIRDELIASFLGHRVLFERHSIGRVNRSLCWQDASGRAPRNSLGADEFRDHCFAIAGFSRLPSLPEHLVPPDARERRSRNHLNHGDTEARVAQTAAETPSDRNINSAPDVALVCLQTISAIVQADDGEWCRLSASAAVYRRADANTRSMCPPVVSMRISGSIHRPTPRILFMFSSD